MTRKLTCKCGTEFETSSLRRRMCYECSPAVLNRARRYDAGTRRLMQLYLQADSKAKVKILARNFLGDNGQISQAALNLLLMQAVNDWVDGGNQKIGEILASRLIPERKEIKEERGIDEPTRNLIEGMSRGEKMKALKEYLGSAEEMPVKADMNLLKDKQ